MKRSRYIWNDCLIRRSKRPSQLFDIWIWLNAFVLIGDKRSHQWNRNHVMWTLNCWLRVQCNEWFDATINTDEHIEIAKTFLLCNCVWTTWYLISICFSVYVCNVHTCSMLGIHLGWWQRSPWMHVCIDNWQYCTILLQIVAIQLISSCDYARFLLPLLLSVESNTYFPLSHFRHPSRKYKSFFHRFMCMFLHLECTWTLYWFMPSVYHKHAASKHLSSKSLVRMCNIIIMWNMFDKGQMSECVWTVESKTSQTHEMNR